jgi:hypothetical protein
MASASFIHTRRLRQTADRLRSLNLRRAGDEAVHSPSRLTLGSPTAEMPCRPTRESPRPDAGADSARRCDSDRLGIEVYAYDPPTRVRILQAGGEPDDEDLLPGFRAALSTLFDDRERGLGARRRSLSLPRTTRAIDCPAGPP